MRMGYYIFLWHLRLWSWLSKKLQIGKETVIEKEEHTDPQFLLWTIKTKSYEVTLYASVLVPCSSEQKWEK